MRVQLPLGALHFSVWESLGIRLVRDQETVGSNPTTLTAASAALCLRQQGCNCSRYATIAVGPVLVREDDC